MARTTVEQTATNRLIRRPEVERLTSLSRSALYSAMSEGRFPRPVSLGRRSVAWRLRDIEGWIESRPDVEAGRFDDVRVETEGDSID